MSDVTQILGQIASGDPSAAHQLMPLVYDELRRLAAQRLSREKAEQTLEPTALVHEAYVRLVDVAKAQNWNSRRHFFAAAAEAMRRILVEQARRKASLKRGGGHERVPMSMAEPLVLAPNLDLLALDEALEQLEREDPRSAQVVKLRFFAGLTIKQVADALEVSVATAENDWAYAKSWLKVRIAPSSGEETRP
jgi:RNA polymerase sigma factor (TIGR02999 family)